MPIAVKGILTLFGEHCILASMMSWPITCSGPASGGQLSFV